MSARALTILNRFPLHMAATDAGKRFGETAGALADGLDVLTRQVGDVRSAHRLAEAPTVADLLGLAALHGLGAAALEPVLLRLRVLADAAAQQPPDPAALAPLVGLPTEALAALGDALATTAGRPARHRPALHLRRSVTSAVIDAHLVGNATPPALLTAAAGYLGLAVEELFHTEDRWWHLARCRDQLRLRPPAAQAELTPLPDLLALEENPFHDADLEPVARRHAQRFRVLRGGLEDVDVGVRVRGVGSRTVRPMVVQLDAGHGLVFEGDVPDGAELRFAASGRVTLDGADVTGSGWAFTGAVFASGAEQLPFRPRQRGWTAQWRGGTGDFRFADADRPTDPQAPDADRTARFVVTTPLADALEPTAALPHGAARVGPLRLPVGQSNWACFVRVAHAGSASGTGPATPAITGISAGHFDGAVFADAAGPPVQPSLAVGFAWEEREPFAVRVLVPRRFAALDDEAGTRLRQPLRGLLDRHRAAGVNVRVKYADPRWTLGSGVLRTTTEDPLGTVLAGTELWPDGTEQPNP
jgi:hypothetical protein